MKKSIKQQMTILLGVFFMVIMIPIGANAQETIEIQVSPNILNIQSNGVVVTIHTDIPFSQVDAQSVSLAGVEIDSWKADNQGYFVAKFDMEEIKDIEELVIGEYNTLTLDGLKYSGETFTGSEEVLVINNIPAGKNK